MTRRVSLVPIAAPLQRALAAFRRVQPSPALQQQLREALERIAGSDEAPKKQPLVLVGGMALALLMDLPTLLAAAQGAQPGATQATADDTSIGSDGAATAAADPGGSPGDSPGPAAADPAGASPAANPAGLPPVAADTSGAAPPAAPPPATAHPPVEVEASLTRGLRFVVPDLAHFTIELHGSVWIRANIESTQDVPAGDLSFTTADYFSVNLVRPQLAMSAFDGLIRAYIQPELAGVPRLLDAQLELVPDPAFALRVGQYRTPFSRAWITSIMQMELPDRGVIANNFSTDPASAGRDTGAMVYGTPLDGLIEYYAGVFNGSGIDGRLGDTPVPMVVGRFVVTPLGQMPYSQTPSLDHDDMASLSFGINGYYRENEVEVMGTNVNDQIGSSAGDVAVAFGTFYLQAEGFYRTERLATVTNWTTAWGAYAQAGLFVLPRVLDVSARGSWADADVDTPGGLVQAYEGAIAGYFALDDTYYGQHLKLVVNYRFADNAGPATFGYGPDVILQGSSHRAIAQAQLWF